jgi:hypothetical protein
MVAADTLNGAAISFFDAHELPPPQVLAGRGCEYCGNRERHEYALCLEVESVVHVGTKAKSLQTNGICERFDKTREDGFHVAALRRKARRSIGELQLGFGQWARRETLSREEADADLHGFDAVSRRKTDWLR